MNAKEKSASNQIDELISDIKCEIVMMEDSQELIERLYVIKDILS